MSHTGNKIEVPDGFYTKIVKGQVGVQCATCKRTFKTDRIRIVANIEWLAEHARECKQRAHDVEVAKFLSHQKPDD